MSLRHIFLIWKPLGFSELWAWKKATFYPGGWGRPGLGFRLLVVLLVEAAESSLLLAAPPISCPSPIYVKCFSNENSRHNQSMPQTALSRNSCLPFIPHPTVNSPERACQLHYPSSNQEPNNSYLQQASMSLKCGGGPVPSKASQSPDPSFPKLDLAPTPMRPLPLFSFGT